jgi:hypothetical protein
MVTIGDQMKYGPVPESLDETGKLLCLAFVSDSSWQSDPPWSSQMISIHHMHSFIVFYLEVPGKRNMRRRQQ